MLTIFERLYDPAAPSAIRRGVVLLALGGILLSAANVEALGKDGSTGWMLLLDVIAALNGTFLAILCARSIGHLNTLAYWAIFGFACIMGLTLALVSPFTYSEYSVLRLPTNREGGLRLAGVLCCVMSIAFLLSPASLGLFWRQLRKAMAGNGVS